MKYKIEKNTVQETLIIPLYARKVCSELYPNLYQDETAVRLINEIDYDFSDADKNARSLMQHFGSLEVAMRQNDLAWEVRDYLKTHPNAAVVNLGCGLDSTGRSCDNGSCKIYNLDFPNVISVRNELLPAGERELRGICRIGISAFCPPPLFTARGRNMSASWTKYGRWRTFCIDRAWSGW
jgi:O-methyltransferase involved in polyketide biosynthesis